MKYKLHFPFGSRVDLLRAAVESARDIGNIHLWADGIECPRDIPDVTVHEVAPVTIVSLMNICLKESWDDDVAFFMHNDAYAKPGVAQHFKEYVESCFSRPGWGVIFSHYDVLCAFNMKAVHAVGYWDTAYFQYTADTDYYHTLKVNGWKVIDFPDGHEFRDGVVHYGSTSIKSDKIHAAKVRFFGAMKAPHSYYAMKWGGPEGHERFKIPFQDIVEGRRQIQHYYRRGQRA